MQTIPMNAIINPILERLIKPFSIGVLFSMALLVTDLSFERGKMKTKIKPITFRINPILKNISLIFLSLLKQSFF